MKPPIDLIRATAGIRDPGDVRVAVDAVQAAATQSAPAEPRPPEPLALSDYIWEKILDHVASGLPLTNACRLEGIEPGRVTQLFKVRPDMASQVAQAKQGLLKRMVGVIVTAADKGDYRAAAIMVNRLDPQKDKRYNPPAKKAQTLTIDQVKSIQTLTLEDLRARTE